MWVSLDPAARPAAIPAFPEPGSVPGLRILVGEPMVWRTSAGRHVENILDLAHFWFVYLGSFGCTEAQVVEPHDVVAEPGRISKTVTVTSRGG